MRRVITRLWVDDDKLWDKHGGVIDGVEWELGSLNDNGLVLEDAFIADDDETDKWYAYVNYVANWCFDSKDEGSSPMLYEDWTATYCEKALISVYCT